MSEAMKKFLEFMSEQEKEVGQKVAKMEKADVIAFAAEKGFSLTDADFEPQEDEGEISLDEADAVAGGGECYCPVVGGGTEEIEQSWGEDFGDGGCACVAYGQGDSIWESQHDGARCTCVLGGYGHSDA